MSIGRLIGNTPMIKIKVKYLDKIVNVFAKLEYYNYSGSIKDRLAYYIINESYKNGSLKKNMPIVEATSGNTGIAFAALGAFYGHEVHIFMPDWASIERIKLMKSYGANVILFSKEDGGFIRCVEEAKKYAEENDAFLANQFANEDNFKAHFDTTGGEIINKLPEKAAGFVSGVGTGGTLMGTGKRLKNEYEDFKIIAIEPDKMPLISKGEIIGNHKIEGIGDDFIPDLVDKNAIDDIVLINDDDAVNMARKLAKELGLGVGISSGANFIGSVLSNEKINKPIVTVFADDNKKYLTTDLSKEIDKNESFISNNIKLIDYEIV